MEIHWSSHLTLHSQVMKNNKINMYEQCNQVSKAIKSMRIGNDGLKLFLSVDNMIISLENSKDSMRKLL